MIGRWLCKLGWHNYRFITEKKELQQGNLIWLELRTKCRCQRDSCPRSLWWLTCEVETMYVGRVQSTTGGPT